MKMNFFNYDTIKYNIGKTSLNKKKNTKSNFANIFEVKKNLLNNINKIQCIFFKKITS